MLVRRGEDVQMIAASVADPISVRGLLVALILTNKQPTDRPMNEMLKHDIEYIAQEGAAEVHDAPEGCGRVEE